MEGEKAAQQQVVSPEWNENSWRPCTGRLALIKSYGSHEKKKTQMAWITQPSNLDVPQMSEDFQVSI